MAVVKKPRAVIDILDSEGKITNHEVEYHVTFEAVTPEDEEIAKNFTPKIIREEVSHEVAQQLRGEAESATFTSNKQLNQQIADMQSVSDATAKAAAETQAKLTEDLQGANQVIVEITSRHNALAARLAQIAKIIAIEN